MAGGHDFIGELGDSRRAGSSRHALIPHGLSGGASGTLFGFYPRDGLLARTGMHPRIPHRMSLRAGAALGARITQGLAGSTRAALHSAVAH